MMNKYINILKYKYLHSHQTFIKRNSLMKRENRKDRPHPIPQTMNFSFREWFDE